MKTLLWWKQLLLCFSYIYCFADKKCLDQEFIERHFYVNEFDLPLKIEVSNRLSHRLVSNIAKILLIEAVGYPYVTLVQQDRDTEADNATKTMQNITSCSTPQNCNKIDFLGPDVMINLEVWLNPGFNMDEWLSTGRIEDLGPLGPLGRSGWYIADYTVKYYWESNNTIIDHWKAFTNPDIAKIFDLSQEESVYNLSVSKKYCKYKECDADGVYRFSECRKPTSQCATLLADYPASNFELLTREIKRLKLLVNIIWVGEKLEDIVEKRTVTNKNTLFFHHMPSILSALGSFVRVSFPNCVEEKDSSCEFETSQLEKVVWSAIKTDAPHAFHVLKKMQFSQAQYSDLLKLYRDGVPRGIGVWDQACKWVNRYLHIWTLWMPGDLDHKTTLYIAGIFPLTGIYKRQASVAIAAEMAVDAINKNPSILENYQLKLLKKDGQCAAGEVMHSFINYMTTATYKTMVGILGPACSDTVEPIAGMAKEFRTLIISYSAEGALFNQSKYPVFYRTIPENNHFTYVYLKLFEQLKYTRVAALTEDGQKYPEYISRLQDQMQNRKMSFIENRKFPRERESLKMRPYLEDLKNKGAKIIIGDFYDYAARAVMCEAYRLGMTAAREYVWFLPFGFSANWFDTSNKKVSHTSDVGQVDCTTAEMWEAINGHLSLAYKFYGDDTQIMQEQISVATWLNKYVNETNKKGMEISHYGGYAYDAVWVYAMAVDALLKENKSNIASLHANKTHNRLIQLINETNFNGVSGSLFFRGPSRISDVIIWQWIDNVTYPVGVYHPFSQTHGELEFNETKIVWLTPNGEKPRDGSMKAADECTLESFRRLLGTSCETATVMVNVIALLSFGVLILIVVFSLKKRYDRKMKMTEARMKELGLNANNGPFALDEWEIPRDQIVINRKLGEGAFGTVFGGEAKSVDKGWIAVAVKTLKSGAKPEEKLDFLSEAEVMKQLDHINIVKLIGVCTMGEPVYTVMEFMLYGDLKTYLLSRRSLIASEKDRSHNDEVSDKRLTNMALDIARGLSYLADKKFVHRDLACRNCLVNLSRSVKIADFGMCRAMFDSDYYRYNKKGMLPVRWMSPESLTDGLFTPMSDVWSYGVVLYEIITFASVPYQGLSNNQVLDHIKRHKILPVPTGVTPRLGALLQQCWSRSPRDRPQAAEIVEILAENPELITPCLDLPSSSVQVMDYGTLQIHNRDRERVHSFSSVWQTRKAAIHDQLQIGLFEPTRVAMSSVTINNGLIKHTGFKFNAKKGTFHESFRKKSKRNFDKHKYPDSLSQSTYL